VGSLLLAGWAGFEGNVEGVGMGVEVAGVVFGGFGAMGVRVES